MAELMAQHAGIPSPTAVRARAEPLRTEFSVLAEQWRRDTLHLSTISQKVEHPAYQQIIRMGNPVVPLILEALRDQPGHWFAALRAASNVDPAPQAANPSAARKAWLEWGRREGLVGMCG